MKLSLLYQLHQKAAAFTTMAATNPPTFQPPTDLNDSDNELWLVRAPANMDVSAILNNIQLDLIDPSSSNSKNNNSTTVLSKFKSSGGAAGDEEEGGSPEEEEEEEYTLSLGDVNEIQNMRLLVPEEEAKEANSDSDSSSDDDDDDGKKKKKKKKKETSKLMTPYTRPFQHHIHITSSYADQSELTIAPSQNSAPNPATGDDYRGKNGRVENIRLAYVPVPQKRGLKRRWNMPGGGKIDAATVKADDASYAVKKEEEDVTTDDDVAATKSTEMASSSSKKRVKKEEDDVMTDEDAAAKSTEKLSSKKQKSSSKHSSSKKKKKKEKKKKV